MSVSVFMTTGPEEGHKFDTLQRAEEFLRVRGYQPRPQSGEWVNLLGSGNLFASIIIDGGHRWTPNYGKGQ